MGHQHVFTACPRQVQGLSTASYIRTYRGYSVVSQFEIVISQGATK